MKTNKFQLLFATTLLALIITSKANAQKYTTVADTPALNKEYRQVSADLAELNKRLTDAQGKTSNLMSKVTTTSQDAQSAAIASEQQASTATNGDLKDLRKEEKKAEKANKKAKDQKDAQKDLKANQKEIKHLNEEISKKQKRLAELDKERDAIMGKQ